MKIQRNRNPLGWRNNLVFGLCQLADGLIRTMSLGFLFSDLTLTQTRNATRRHFDKQSKHKESP